MRAPEPEDPEQKEAILFYYRFGKFVLGELILVFFLATNALCKIAFFVVCCSDVFAFFVVCCQI